MIQKDSALLNGHSTALTKADVIFEGLICM